MKLEVSKWTPGPWETYSACEDGEEFWFPDGVISVGKAIIDPDYLADARLIAVAPEMADIIELVARLPIRDHLPDDVPVTGIDGVYITQGDVRNAREVIAKARGETKEEGT